MKARLSTDRIKGLVNKNINRLVKNDLSNSKNENRPELFDFNSNKGKTVSLILKNENSKTGILLGLCPDNAIILEYTPVNAVSFIGEVQLSDVSDILILEN